MIQSSDHSLAGFRFGSGHRQKNTITATTNKSRAEQEPCSAHGRAVKKAGVKGHFLTNFSCEVKACFDLDKCE